MRLLTKAQKVAIFSNFSVSIPLLLLANVVDNAHPGLATPALVDG